MGSWRTLSNHAQSSGVPWTQSVGPMKIGVPMALLKVSVSRTPTSVSLAGTKPSAVDGASTCWKRRSPAIGERGPTLRVADWLATELTEFEILTLNFEPLSPGTTVGVVKEDEVAPSIGIPFSLHWKVRGAGPVASTVKVPV